MPESGDEALIARIADALRQPVALSAGFEARVMAGIRAAPPSLPAAAWGWLREPRTIAVSPLGGLAMAAGVAGMVLVSGLGIGIRESGVGPAPAVASAAPEGPQPVTFVLLAPRASAVAVAGDFNGWDGSRMPMRRGASGLWTLDVPLVPGRYQYVFVVDGRRFVADPAAPRSAGDDFGTPSSVVTVNVPPGAAAGGAL